MSVCLCDRPLSSSERWEISTCGFLQRLLWRCDSATICIRNIVNPWIRDFDSDPMQAFPLFPSLPLRKEKEKTTTYHTYICDGSTILVINNQNVTRQTKISSWRMMHSHWRILLKMCLFLMIIHSRKRRMLYQQQIPLSTNHIPHKIVSHRLQSKWNPRSRWRRRRAVASGTCRTDWKGAFPTF